MLLPNRGGSADSYRYGYNSMEKDDEISGEGNSYTAQFWQYDPRVARRWNLDPVVVANESPYAAFRNNPIIYNDPLGDCADCPKPTRDGKKEGDTETTSHTVTIPSTVYPGMSSSLDETQKWYWHEGSKEEVTNEDGTTSFKEIARGWYKPAEYKKILTGGSAGNVNDLIPNNVFQLGRDLLGGDEGEITEKDLTVDELSRLREIVLRNLKNGKMVIDYADYQTHNGSNPYSDVTSINGKTKGTGGKDRWAKLAQPSYILKTLIGAAEIKIENGQVYVIDRYNFNDAQKAQQGKSFIQKVKSYNTKNKETDGNFYKKARNLGTHFGSQEGEGDKIRILIKRFKR